MRTIIQILIYFVLSLMTCFIYEKNKKNGKKISLTKIIIISVLFTLYNVLCTYFSIRTVGDRANYAYEFMGYRATSVGLSFVFNIIKIFTMDVRILYYAITFFCCFITFFCCFRDKDTNKYALYFLLATDFVFFTFVALKQCFVCAFATLIYYIINNSKSRFKYVICALLIYISCLFHSTGFILIPIVILLFIYDKKRINLPILFFSVMLLLVFFNPLLSLLSSFLGRYVPALSGKINDYFYTTGLYTESKLVFVKGLPFYLISIIATVKRKIFSKDIKNYDKLVFMSYVGSISYFISIVSYWMYRITNLFYFPISVLFGIIMKNENNPKNKLLYFVIIFGSEFLILLRWLFLEFMQGGF